MEILYNNNIINEIVTKLFRHRRNDYSEFLLDNLVSVHELIHSSLPATNSKYQQLQTSLFTATPETPTTCIVFLHGYGSNRLECSNLLPFVDDQMGLCAFDFSGSGKSQGDSVTYGMKEKEDIRKECILNYLRRMGFKKFVLWGRSMGATSSLLFCLSHQPEDVVLQIVDSPFYSFEMIAFQIASKNVKAPQFVISFALEMSKKNCQKFQFNPFDIVLKDVADCRVPAIFVYCEEDDVINAHNTHLICERFKNATFQKLLIKENHNTIRSQATVTKIISFIKKYLQPKKDKTRSIDKFNNYFIDNHAKSNLSEKTFTQSPSIFSQTPKKGIKRVEQHQHQRQRFDDYGIWVASKFQPSQLDNYVKPKQVRGNETPKKLHLSLSSSFAQKTKSSDVREGPQLREFTHREGSCIFNSESSKRSLLSRRGKLSTVRTSGVRSQLNNSKYL